jgi:hypothetical protein
MRPVLCLLPSPLLGPACWRPTGEALSDDGWEVAGVPVPPRPPRTGADALGTYLAAIPDDRDVVLVPHSNAGLFVPALAAMRRAAGYVFVDAGLPGDADRVPMIPAEFCDMLAGMADGDGMLPPWTHWWDGEDVSALFPSARVRAEVEAEQQRLPLSYFEETLSIPRGWPDRPGAYLAFGDTYAAARSAAAARGWPVTTLAGEHLHMVVDPPGVAAAIASLVRDLLRSGSAQE